MNYCGIIILNYNTPSDTINCIETVLKYNTARIKIVVVDNASTDDSVDRISNYVNTLNNKIDLAKSSSSDLPFISLISASKNLGYACGNNLGIDLLQKDSSVDNILILNSDILFVEDIIPSLEKDLKEKEAVIVSPTLYKKDMVGVDYNCARLAPSFFELFLHFLLSAHEPGFLKKRRLLLKKTLPGEKMLPVELPSGSCMLFSKNMCNKLGIFDPNTFLYYEENIISSKIKKMKLGVIYVDTSLKCIHLGATSTRKAPSRRIVEAEVQSALYYVNAFASQSFLWKKIFKITCTFYLMLDTFKRSIKMIA